MKLTFLEGIALIAIKILAIIAIIVIAPFALAIKCIQDTIPTIQGL